MKDTCFYMHHYDRLVDSVFLNSVAGAYLAYLILGTRLHLRICVLAYITLLLTPPSPFDIKSHCTS